MTQEKKSQIDILLGPGLREELFVHAVKRLTLRHQQVLLAIIGQRLKGAGVLGGQTDAQYGRLRVILQEQYSQLSQTLTRLEQGFYGWLIEMYQQPAEAWHVCHQHMHGQPLPDLAAAWKANPALLGPVKPGAERLLNAMSVPDMARLWQAMKTARTDKAKLEQMGFGL